MNAREYESRRYGLSLQRRARSKAARLEYDRKLDDADRAADSARMAAQSAFELNLATIWEEFSAEVRALRTEYQIDKFPKEGR